jgi:hypothetical protein
MAACGEAQQLAMPMAGFLHLSSPVTEARFGEDA